MFFKLYEPIFFKGEYKNNFRKVIIASTGRSGSTFLRHHIVYSFINKYLRIPYKFQNPDLKEYIVGTNTTFKRDQLSFFDHKVFSSTMSWGDIIDYNNLDEKKIFIKTHDYYRIKNDTIKYIFIFRDPLAILTSILSKIDNSDTDFLSSHLTNLNSDYNIDNIFEKDILNYIDLSNSYIKNKNEGNIFFLDFENLANSSESLSDFLGFNIKMKKLKNKPYHPKIKMVKRELIEKLQATYAELKSCEA